MNLDALAELDSQAKAISEALAPETRMQVEIRAGVPRAYLLESLARHLDAAVTVVLPPLYDPDASLHGLLQAAAPLGPRAVDQATQDSTALRDRARATGAALACAGRTLVVWVPASWSVSDTTGNPDPQVRRHRAEEMLGGWLSVAGLSVVLFVHRSSAGLIDASAGITTEWHRRAIEPPLSALPEDEAWGTYAEAAALLRRALERRQTRLSGLQLRLLVALIGLGATPRDLVDSSLQTRDLTRRFADLLAMPSAREIARGVSRFLQARRPVPREVARAIAGLPDQHQALITCCLGEGEDLIDVDDGLRERLREKLQARFRTEEAYPVPEPEVHLALAEYHSRLDGDPSPAAAWAHIDHWLENMHHLSLSGPLGAERWHQRERPTRELYWDRARSQSLDYREYLDAASLYQECIECFDSRDAYSWHYLGFNLDRAGVRRKDAEQAFRKAVELRPDHPWYNGRLVTFLIDQARFRAAQEEWSDALGRMDPDGENVAESPWLAKEAHRWVVKAWLRFGEAHRARKVLDDIPAEQFSEELWYQDLREAVEDAEEGRRLGESVYPSTTLMRDRWILPRELIEIAAGQALRSWFPGRVTAVDRQGVHLVLAVPEADVDKRRLISRTLTTEEWHHYARCEAEEGRFIFLAIYEHTNDPQETILLLEQPVRPASSAESTDAEIVLRYMRARA